VKQLQKWPFQGPEELYCEPAAENSCSRSEKAIKVAILA
jgi:hypothetical protein